MDDNDHLAVEAIEGPVRIIDVDATGESFHLDQAKLSLILDQIPESLPVCVLSVVGAFRTGKSFLLDLFLRYLRYYDENPDVVPIRSDLTWLGEGILEGQHARAPSYNEVKTGTTQHQIQELKRLPSTRSNRIIKVVKVADEGEQVTKSGFKWRPGDQRTTTGIWFWSRPFVRTSADGKKLAVILMDTQGLFDSSTNQMLTTCIFGLSALISSYVIFNLKERVQEDHLQHLALFSEYGRRVKEAQQAGAKSTDSPAAAALAQTKPFQRMEFLVRDAVLEFEDVHNYELVKKTFDDYIAGVMGQRQNEDLRTVRDMIGDCYQELACFKLPHPGLAVPRSTYDGNTKVLDPEFKALLGQFMHDVFNKHLAPKVVAGHEVNGIQLKNYVIAYARLFQEKAVFPEARVLVEATAEANCRNAIETATRFYKAKMDEFFGMGYQDDKVVAEQSNQVVEQAMDSFDHIANFGSNSTIHKFREELAKELAVMHADYLARNKERNPLKNVEIIVFAVAIILSGWILKFLLDYTCGPFSDYCRRGSQFFAFVSSFTLLGLIGVILLVGKGAIARLKFMGSALLSLASSDTRVGGLVKMASALTGQDGSAAAPANSNTETSGESAAANLRRRSNRNVA